MADIAKANSSNEIKNGTMVVSCGKTGFPLSSTIVYNEYVKTIPALNSIQDKFANRFDDPSYYFSKMATLSEYTVNVITSLIANKDNHSRYFDGVQANGLYGLDLFLNFYQNNINSGNNDDINATANYVRNPNCWAYNVDLTCCSPWNMHPTLRLSGDVLTGSSHHRPVTLISPRHILGVKHADFYPPSGSYVRFITKDNETITRTITNLIVIPDQVGGVQDTTLYSVDFIVGLLDSEVPDSITFAKILPDDYQNKLQKHNALIAFKNQDQSAIIQKYNGYAGIRRIGTTWDPSPVPLEDYSQEIDNFSVKPSGIDTFSSFRPNDSGSTIFLIINNEPILLGLVNTTGGGAAYPITEYIVSTTITSSGTITNRSSYKNLINSAMTSLGGGYQLTQANLDQFKNITDDPIPSPPAEWQTLYAYNFLNLDGTNNLYTNYPTIDGSLVFTFQYLGSNNTFYYWRDTTTVLYDINGIIAQGSYLNNIFLIFDYIEGIWKITTSDLVTSYAGDFIYSTFDPFNGPWNVINTVGGSYVSGYAAGAVISNSYISPPT